MLPERLVASTQQISFPVRLYAQKQWLDSLKRKAGVRRDISSKIARLGQRSNKDKARIRGESIRSSCGCCFFVSSTTQARDGTRPVHP